MRQPFMLERNIGVAALLLGGLISDPALACSLVNGAASEAHSVTVSNYYWIATSLIGIIVVYMQSRRRWQPVILCLVALLVAFHPAWTVSPNYAFDCTFYNVKASRVVLFIMVILLVHQVMRYLRGARTQQ